MKIDAIGYALPERVVENDEVLDELRGRQRRGVGIAAGRQALEKADLAPEDIDLVIYAANSRGFLEPSTASVFQAGLSLERATCFDILDACAGWMRAVHVARSLIESGQHERAMIINCEMNVRECVNYRMKSPDDLAHLFPGFTLGEVATAAIVSDSEEDDEYYASFRSYGQHRELCMVPLPNARDFALDNRHADETFCFFSYGESLFRLMFALLRRHFLTDERLQKASEPDVIFYHAASDSLAEQMARTVRVDPDRLFLTHSRFGNTVSASIPLAMAVAQEEGRLRVGDQVRLVCGSAGLASGIGQFRMVGD